MQRQKTDISTARDETPSASPVLVNEELLAELERMKRQGTPVFNGGDATVRVLAALLACQAFAPFWSAFTGALGKQLGETTTQVMHRIRLRRVDKRATVDVYGQRADAASADRATRAPQRLLRLEFDPDELSDEARLAMLDIDFTSPYLLDKVLRWSPQAGTWIPVPPRHSAEDQ